MTLAGGCGSKILVRIGGGNLKSVVAILFLGIFAYMTLRGLTGLARVEIENASNLDLEALGLETQGIPDILAALLGLPEALARGATIVALAGGLLWFCFKSAAFRASRRDIAAGLILGARLRSAGGTHWHSGAQCVARHRRRAAETSVRPHTRRPRDRQCEAIVKAGRRHGDRATRIRDNGPRRIS